MALRTFSAPAGTAKGYEAAYGGIPQLPKYTTDTNHTLGTDVQANIIKNLPNYMAMVGSDVKNIGSNLSGQLSADVIQQMQQQAAERGIATGSPGSQNSNAAYLRALGLTSMQLQNLGHSQLNEAIARTPVQQEQTQTATKDWSAEQAVYNAAPMPGPAARQALANAQSGYGYGNKSAGIAPSYGIGAGGSGGGYRPTSSAIGQPAFATYANSPGGGRTGYFDDSVDPAYDRWRGEQAKWNTSAYDDSGFYAAGTPQQVEEAQAIDNLWNNWDDLSYWE